MRMKRPLLDSAERIERALIAGCTNISECRNAYNACVLQQHNAEPARALEHAFIVCHVLKELVGARGWALAKGLKLCSTSRRLRTETLASSSMAQEQGLYGLDAAMLFFVPCRCLQAHTRCVVVKQAFATGLLMLHAVVSAPVLESFLSDRTVHGVVVMTHPTPRHCLAGPLQPWLTTLWCKCSHEWPCAQHQKKGMLSFGLMTIGSPFQSRMILGSASAPRTGSLAGSAAAPLVSRLCDPW